MSNLYHMQGDKSARFSFLQLPFILVFLAFSLHSCASYKIPTQLFLEKKSNKQVHGNKIHALNHPLYNIVPRHRCQIRWYDLGHWTMWMLFGNDDDGIFGEEADYSLEEQISTWKALRWVCRNPFHNFCF